MSLVKQPARPKKRRYESRQNGNGRIGGARRAWKILRKALAEAFKD